METEVRQHLQEVTSRELKKLATEVFDAVLSRFSHFIFY